MRRARKEETGFTGTEEALPPACGAPSTCPASFHACSNRRFRVNLRQHDGRSISHSSADVRTVVLQELQEFRNSRCGVRPESPKGAGCVSPHTGVRIAQGLSQRRHNTIQLDVPQPKSGSRRRADSVIKIVEGGNQRCPRHWLGLRIREGEVEILCRATTGQHRSLCQHVRQNRHTFWHHIRKSNSHIRRSASGVHGFGQGRKCSRGVRTEGSARMRGPFMPPHGKVHLATVHVQLRFHINPLAMERRIFVMEVVNEARDYICAEVANCRPRSFILGGSFRGIEAP